MVRSEWSLTLSFEGHKKISGEGASIGEFLRFPMTSKGSNWLPTQDSNCVRLVRRQRRRGGLCRSILWDELECAICGSFLLRSESSVVADHLSAITLPSSCEKLWQRLRRSADASYSQYIVSSVKVARACLRLAAIELRPFC